MKRPRTFDWKFMVSLAFLLMVGSLVLTGVSDHQQSAEKSLQIDSLISASQRADDAATRQRDNLLSAQRRLLARVDASDARLGNLLAYLRAHGVDIPTRFIEIPSPASGPQPPSRGVPGVPLNAPPKILQPPTSSPGGSGTHRRHPKKPKTHGAH